jgi:hypothetical protein
MKFKYLTQDIKGAMSKNIYAKKNEKVLIIGRQSEMILVINDKGNKFFVNEKYLSNELPTLY